VTDPEPAPEVPDSIPISGQDRAELIRRQLEQEQLVADCQLKIATSQTEMRSFIAGLARKYSVPYYPLNIDITTGAFKRPDRPPDQNR